MERLAADCNIMSSLLTLANTAIGMEQDAKDDHCYAFNDEKSCLEGREKDHNYSTNSKSWFMGHRKTQSFSELNILNTAEFETDTQGNSHLYLPHYQSNDSALDVTGFDTISKKCISYENIDMKTVDVLTGRILPGTSDPDISRMTLGSNLKLNAQSISVPNSPPLSELRTTLEHNYSKDNVLEQLWKQVKEQNSAQILKIDKSPLFDHSYDSVKGLKHTVLGMGTEIKPTRSNEKLNKIYPTSTYSETFTKSPFLDHTYQSVCNKTKKESERAWRKERFYSADRIFPDSPFLDHSYDTVVDTDDQMEIFSPAFVRNRSSSFSAYAPAHDIFRSDHSYVIKNKDDVLSMSCDSDSGTESFTEETVDEPPTSFGSLVSLQKDHAYVTHM